MDLGMLIGMIIGIIVLVVAFWIIYYIWTIYSFLRSCARDIVKKLR